MYVLSIADTLVSSRPWLFAEFFSEQCGRDIAEARVAPLAVVKAFDVFLYCCFRVSPGRVALMVHQLVFQAAPEALHGRVVVAVPPARHGWLHAELLHQFLIVVSAVLAAAVGVMNQSRCRAFVAHGLPQCRCRQLLRHAFVHCVAHQLTGVHVLDAGQVKPALAGGHIGDVGHPGFVRPRRSKGLIEQVVGHRQVVIRVRGGFEFAFLLAAQGELATQADDAVTAGREALCRQFWLHAQRAIGLPALRVHRLDGDLQAGVVLRPLRRFAACPGVETAARDVKDAAQDGDGIIESQRLHDRVPGSDSRAKYAAAFFTISRSMRASASSLRSLVTSASSSGTERLPGATLGDVARLAAATQLASVPLGMVRRDAASSSARPCVKTSFTASSRSSGVYVVERFICSPVGEVYQTKVSEKVRVPQTRWSCSTMLLRYLTWRATHIPADVDRIAYWPCESCA